MSATPDMIRILHVDDEPGFADMAATFLEREDDRFEVETATGTDEGVVRLTEDMFDCVVSDYDMPDRTGLEFLRAVREESPDLPFILYTGKGSEEVASDAISAGATDYLQKESGTGQYELLANRIANAVSRAESQQSERHLRELAENTDRILYIFSHDWADLLFINSAYEDIWGRSIDALRASPTDFLNGVHPDDRATVREVMDQLSGGETIEAECRVNADESYERWARIRGEPIQNETGDVVRVAGFATDVTDRKELQQKLRTRTERLQEAQRVAGVGSWEWDAASDTVVWSDETYRIFGRKPGDPADPTFEDWLAAVHPADRENAQAKVGSAIDTGRFPTFEHQIQRPDGGVRWVKCRGDVTREGGETVRITGTVLDITDRRENERDLEYQRSMLESVIEALPQGVLVVGDDRTVFTYNQRFLDLWDVPEAVADRGDYRELLDTVANALDRPEAFRESVEYFRDYPEEAGHDQLDMADGHTVLRYSAPATNDDGTAYGRVWVFQDVADGTTP